ATAPEAEPGGGLGRPRIVSNGGTIESLRARCPRRLTFIYPQHSHALLPCTSADAGFGLLACVGTQAGSGCHDRFPMAELTPLLLELSHALGTEVTLDESGQWGPLFADDVEIVLALSPEGDALSLRGALVRPDPAAAAETQRLALLLNYGHLPPGFAIALDETSGELLLLASSLVDWFAPGELPGVLAAAVDL